MTAPIRIAPSILSADFAALARDIERVESAFTDDDWLHLDVMDGHFVPNITFGPPLVKSIRAVTKRFLDTHVMIADPMKYAEPFAKGGADGITFHLEAVSDPLPVIERIEAAGAKPGLVINPDTPVERLLPFADRVHLLLVMSVFPGFAGQSFIPESLDRLRAVRDAVGPDAEVEIDGGVGIGNVSEVVAAGANVIVAGSAVFGTPDPAAAVRALREGALEGAARRRA